MGCVQTHYNCSHARAAAAALWWDVFEERVLVPQCFFFFCGEGMMISSRVLQQGSAVTYTEGFIGSLCHLFRVFEVSVTLLLCELRSPPPSFHSSALWGWLFVWLYYTFFTHIMYVQNVIMYEHTVSCLTSITLKYYYHSIFMAGSII